jgi:hypothetical protein
MSSLKTMIVMGILGAAGFWVYMYMGQKPDTTPADAQAFLSPPTVQIPGLNSPAPQLMGAASSGPANAPSTLLGGGSAPPFSTNPSPPSVSMPGNPVAANSQPAGILNHSSAGAVSPSPANAGGVTMLTPPSTTNIPNVSIPNSPMASPAGTTPSLLSSTKTGQTPAAAYPPPAAASLPAISSLPGSSPTAKSPTASSTNNNIQDSFADFMKAVQKKLAEGRLPEAHLILSSLYDNPDLPQAQARQLTELLDQLAGTVIYSRQHYLEQPYIVRPGDTLDQIADKYNVPAILLARINGIRDPQQLEPGQQLKVVRGPFNAVIHLDKHELSLMMDGRYAGRFAIGVGCDQPNLEGTYIVREKKLNPQYRGPDSIVVPGGDSRNPLGRFWIGLSNNVGLHGTVDPQNVGRDDNRGTICLGDRDIDDLYGILSVGSRVVIQR